MTSVPSHIPTEPTNLDKYLDYLSHLIELIRDAPKTGQARLPAYSGPGTSGLHLKISKALIELAQAEKGGLELEEITSGDPSSSDFDHSSKENPASNVVADFILGNGAHTFRTPLNSVLSMLELNLDSSPGLTRDQRENLLVVHSLTKSILVSWDEILDFTRAYTNRIQIWSEPFSLRHALWTGALMGPSKLNHRARSLNVNVTYRYDSNIPSRLCGDPTRLNQVIEILGLNAIQLRPSGMRGNVHVSVDMLDETGNDATVMFTVEDNNGGIENERLVSLLHKGYPSCETSFFIARGIIEMMGSRLDGAAVQGEGSRFSFAICFPKADPVSFYLPFEWQRARILIVSPHASGQLAHTIREIKKAGATVHAVGDVARAASDDAFHVAVFESLDSIKQFYATSRSQHPPIILLTSDSMSLTDLADAQVSAHISRLEELGDALVNISPPDLGETRPSYHVLIAEDNFVNQKILVKILQKLGHESEVVENGESAFERVMSGEHFDAVLMDNLMPLMNGLEATRLIRQFEAQHGGRGRLPIIGVVASAMTGSIQSDCLEAGMDDVIMKPIRRMDLANALARLPSTDA
ncbi:hypothetical protein DL96DRAFT_774498 [Flagelloscypha sp. PMI_526]|nr:hypothetical protein DL96DRAFT_774498 [Flagelloscypha sp. PMI_526]